MKYLVANTSELRIMHNNASSVAEITIQLGLKKPTVTLHDKAYISGVYDKTNGKKNPGMNYCEVNEKKPIILDDWVSISSSTKNQMTLHLKTKLKQL
tara:strand:+ start:2648 stop:2938 length:291 start_codon:yes stop_codon:yes gene_type:complete